jgi:hypothetical protein
MPGREHGHRLSVTAHADRLHIGQRFSVSFQRTLRLPDDGRVYPLPPGLGPLPMRPAADFGDRAPKAWRERGGFLVPLHQREALWLQFEAAAWKPNAVQVAIGGIDALTGEPWGNGLRAAPQNYLVCPDQPWLDGINSGEGTVRQFVAVDLGAAETVEEQLTGASELGGLQLRVYEPNPGRFPDEPPAGGFRRLESGMAGLGEPGESPGMGLAAGGAMSQRIYPDLHGIETWDQHTYGVAFLFLVNSRQYQAITGEQPPPTPITARTYAEHGLPWFRLYDEARGDLPPAEQLREIRSLRELDSERGAAPGPDDESVSVDPDQVIPLQDLQPPSREGGE